jgi:ATP-dependent protease ClpP protease subunit
VNFFKLFNNFIKGVLSIPVIILRTRQRLEEIYADCTGKTLEEVHAACDRDNYMVAEEALAFGLVDEIMDKNKLNG